MGEGDSDHHQGWPQTKASQNVDSGAKASHTWPVHLGSPMNKLTKMVKGSFPRKRAQ